MEERILICYEEHEGKSGARSSWDFEPTPLEIPVFVGGGTHKKYLTIVKKETKATLLRVSNRGNIRYSTVIIQKPVFLSFLGGEADLPDKYKLYAEQELGWQFNLP